MTVIRPNSISGITSITAQANEINFFRSNGTLAGLQINGINFNNTSGISTLAALNVTGNVSIAGTLTYEDVTNVDSVGIITARSTIDAQGDVSIADKIIHTGDTNTAIRFPAADTISFECAGEEILKIGKSSTELLRISGPIDASTQQEFGIGIAVNDAHTHPAAKITFKEFDASDSRGDLLFYTRGTNNDVASTERLRITSTGKVNIGDTQMSQNILNIEDGTAAALDIASHGTGGDTAYIGVKKSSGGGLTFGISNRDIIFKTGASYSSGTTFDSGTERLRIASNGFLTVTTTGQGSGIRLVDSSTSSGSPNLEIISKRQDANVNTAFSANIFLGRNRTDQKIATNTFLGNVAFGGNHTDGTEGNISYAAAITARSSGDFNSKSDMPTDLIFTTGTSGTDRDGEAAGQSNVGTERLRIDSRGAVTKPNNPAFFARPPGNYNLSGDTIIGGTWSTSDSEAFVRGTLANGSSIWDNSTGIFTVPVTGIYYFHWNVFLKNNTTRRDAMIYLNGTGGGNIIARTEIGDPAGTTANNKSVAVSAVVSLSVNDEIKFGCLTAGTVNKIYQSNKPWSYACGYLIG